jgi:chromosome segregation ATPase
MPAGPQAESQPSVMPAAESRRLVMCLGIDRPETPDLSDDEPPPPKYSEYRKDEPQKKGMEKRYANLPKLSKQLRLLEGYHHNRTFKELGRDLDRLRKMMKVLNEQHVFSRQDVADRFANNRKFTEALLEEVNYSLKDDMEKFKGETKAMTEEIRMKIKASLTQVVEYMNKMRSESDLLADTQFKAAQQLLKHNTQMGVIEHELSATIKKIVTTEHELNTIFATIRREMDLKDTKISSIELELAANDVKMAEKDAEMASIKRELAEIKSKNTELEQRFERLEQLYPHSS